MITPDHELPISTQAKLLNISRGTVYYLPKPTSEKDLAIMRQIDELHLQHPTMGARMLRDQLNRQGFKVGRRHVSTLMKKMGIVPLSCQKNTSAKHPGHKIYPYAVIDWASRKVLAAKVAITLEACHAVEVLEEAYQKHGYPQVVNVDQGSQFTAEAFVSLVAQSGAQISMDGKGSWRDNVFIERLWKTLKYNHVYLHAYESVSDARTKILNFLDWYNTQRPHSSLDRMTPDEMYFKTLPPVLKAA